MLVCLLDHPRQFIEVIRKRIDEHSIVYPYLLELEFFLLLVVLVNGCLFMHSGLSLTGVVLVVLLDHFKLVIFHFIEVQLDI